MEERKKKKAIIVSVGGTPAPIIYALNQSEPEYICFFLSEETKYVKEEILRRLTFKYQHYDWIVTRNAELLSECYSALSRKLPEILEKWEIPPENLCVDYTGGTKTMSAALVLATVDKSCCYSYVGGSERSKGGIGVVLDGKEKRWFLDNPWDEVALSQKKEAATLFNKGRYASSSDVIKNCIDKVSLERKPYFTALHNMMAGYDLWDRFKHKEAKTKLYASLNVLETFAAVLGDKESKVLVDRIRANLAFLERLVQDNKPSISHFYDLLSNARRRADLEQKFDDAVARLYRAIEVRGQVELAELKGVATGDVPPDIIPEKLRDEYIQRYTDPRDSRLKLPLYATYVLLKEIGSPLGKCFYDHFEKKLRGLLNVRNQSILAHGFDPVSEKTFHELWKCVLEFTQTEEGVLEKFPVLKL